MKLTIDRAALLRSLSHVQSAVERRNTIPILANVLLRAEDGALAMTTTDMDLEINESVAATVQAQDFKGLRKLQAQTGSDFITGIVLYDGTHALPFGNGLWAIPLSAL